MAGQRNIYTFIIPDPHPSPPHILVCEIIKHQEDLFMALGILQIKYNHLQLLYIVTPFSCLLIYNIFCWGGGGGGVHTYFSTRVGWR